MSAHVTCDDFDDAVDELAVGAVDEPRRSEFLAHAATCARCERELRELAEVSDRLLVLAPVAEAPSGFETRVLERIAPTAHRSTRRVWGAVVAGVAAAVLIGVFVASLVAGSSTTVERGTVVSAAGARVGEVLLSGEPTPHVLLTIDDPQRGPGERSCELQLASGERMVVGSWSYEDIEHGVWAVGIDTSLLHAVTMRVLDPNGKVIATARLHDA